MSDPIRAVIAAGIFVFAVDRMTERPPPRVVEKECPAVPELVEVPAPPAMVWAATVREFSSQYSEGNWGAQQVIGRPDVWPASGDQVKAWASLGADDRVELLEVGLERAARLNAVEIYETYNPGAVSKVELITESGRHFVVNKKPTAEILGPANKRRSEFGCTEEKIVAVRVTIDSPAVEGWNEIDAIGGEVCE